MNTGLSGLEYLRYNRQIKLDEFGEKSQEKLKNASVFIVGAGGLGCPVLQYLSACGVGTIGIADYDKVDLSNLHRQILYSLNDVGRYKTEVLKQYMGNNYPHINFNCFNTKLNSRNIMNLLKDYALVIDGSDNFSTKYLVNDACVILNKPLIFGSIYKFEGQISVFNYKNGPTYRCLYPEMGELDNCSETGVIGTLPGIVGTVMANEAIKVLTGIGDILSGRLLVIDSLALNFSVFNISADPDNKNITELKDDDVSCGVNEGEILYTELEALLSDAEKEVLLIDVRDEREHLNFNIGGTNIPLSRLENDFQNISNDLGFGNSSHIVFYCKTGFRSKKAMTFVSKRQWLNAFSLKGGLDGIITPHAAI
jgi:molybdopterin/thiamine biosynthesis adenylyltransferase/rhodanese-related sulfurtransferase